MQKTYRAFCSRLRQRDNQKRSRTAGMGVGEITVYDSSGYGCF